MVDAAILTSATPLVYAAGALIGVGLLWAVKVPRLALLLLGASLLTGQLIRLPLPGQGGGLLLSDIAASTLLVAAWWRLLQRPSKQRHAARLTLYVMTPFILWSLFTLVVGAGSLPLGGVLVAGLYWVRLTVYLLLLPALLVLLEDTNLRTQLTRVFLGSLTLIVGLAAVQLWFVPDLQLFGQGWDPHLQRAVSTWLDPNFLGAYLVIGLVYAAALLPGTRHRVLLLLLMAATVIAILFTQSRSALVMLGGGGLVMLPWLVAAYGHVVRRRWPLILGFTCLATAVLALGVIMLGNRALGAVAYGPTVEIRLAALTTVWELVSQFGLVGVGYNAYQFAAIEAGLIGDFNIHSRAGADNSLLTLWVTTGIVGLALFMSIGTAIWFMLLRRWQQYHSPLTLAAGASLVGLLLHSQFINSLLYAHLLIVLAVIVALALTAKPQLLEQRL